MFGQIGPHLVGGCPPDVLGEVGRCNIESLVSHRQQDERCRQTEQLARLGPIESAIDEAADELRIDHLEGDAGQQQHPQRDHPCAKRAEVVP